MPEDVTRRGWIRTRPRPSLSSSLPAKGQPNLGQIARGTAGRLQGLFPHWHPEEQEIVFARAAPGAQLEYDLKVSFFVAFGEVEGMKGEPASGALDAIAGEVERIIVATKAEARRFGLV